MLGWAWYSGDVGYVPIALASVLATLFFLFQARVPCGGLNRDDTFCRNNAKGLLLGCSQVVAHRWYNAKMLIRRSTWGRFFGNAFRKFSGAAAALSAMAGIASAIIAAGALIVSTYAFLDPRAPR